MSIKISKKKTSIIYILIIYENNIHLKIEKDIYQVLVLINDLKKIHVPNYILLFVPHLRFVYYMYINIPGFALKRKIIGVRNQCA
jgi:hypothetical protein